MKVGSGNSSNPSLEQSVVQYLANECSLAEGARKTISGVREERGGGKKERMDEVKG